MTARLGAFGFLLASVALAAQTGTVKVPPNAVNQLAKPSVATVEAKPNPAVVNSPVDLQVIITPAVKGPLQYEIDVRARDGRLTHSCATDSPVCQWTPDAPGLYMLQVKVSRPAQGRGAPAPEIVEQLSRVLVTPAPSPTPPDKIPTPAPDKTPDTVVLPEITVKLLSPKVVAGESARFSVSLVNASPLEYTIDMGDGKPQTKTDEEFTYTYAEPGTATIVASYPVNSPIVSSKLDITIERAPATALIIVSPAFPWIWIYIVVGVVGVAFVVWLLKKLPPPPPPPPPPTAPHPPSVVPAATFHPHPDAALRFDPSEGNGIALEVHYVPNIASLSYTPRVRINEEQS